MTDMNEMIMISIRIFYHQRFIKSKVTPNIVNPIFQMYENDEAWFISKTSDL